MNTLTFKKEKVHLLLQGFYLLLFTSNINMLKNMKYNAKNVMQKNKNYNLFMVI